MEFQMGFDAASLSAIAQMYGFATLLMPEVQQAIHEIDALIIQKTHDNGLARFKQNSPGGLAESFVETNISPYESQVGTDKPYGHRLDAGFVGTDSIGRYYKQSPTWFFSDAITEVETSGEGLGLLQAAVEAAIGMI